MNLSWTGSEGLVYRVHQATPIFNNVLEYETLASYSSTNVTETSTKITGLTNGTRYYFVVTTLKDGKEGPASNEVIGFPDFPIPATPTGLVVTVVQ